jgi:recombinational DNA repair protein RecR
MIQNEDTISQRAKQAQKIISAPRDFKICEGCGSIVIKKTVACPSCHAYRFDDSTVRIVHQARLLAARVSHSVLSSDLI